MNTNEKLFHRISSWKQCRVAHNRSSWTREYDCRPSVSTALFILHFLNAAVVVVVTFVAIVAVVSLISCVYVSVYMEFCVVYPTATTQYSPQFTQYFSSGRLPLTVVYSIGIFDTYTRVRTMKYICMRRRISIDNAHQKTVHRIHSFQCSSIRSKRHVLSVVIVWRSFPDYRKQFLHIDLHFTIFTLYFGPKHINVKSQHKLMMQIVWSLSSFSPNRPINWCIAQWWTISLIQ